MFPKRGSRTQYHHEKEIILNSHLRKDMKRNGNDDPERNVEMWKNKKVNEIT